MEARESNSTEVECAPGAITVARARPAMCRSVDPSRPLKGSFWSSVDAIVEGIGVTRECVHQVLNGCRAVEYEGNTLASPAFGDMFCMPRDGEEQQFLRRVLQSPEVQVQATSVSMGPPPDVDLKPHSLTSIFEASGDSGYTASGVVEALEASGSETRSVKRDRAGAGKTEEADGADTMVVDSVKVDSSIKEVDDVKQEEEGDEEEQGSKRARTTVVVDEAEKERKGRECRLCWSSMRRHGGSCTSGKMVSSSPGAGREELSWQETTRHR